MTSEPEVAELDDEVGDIPLAEAASGPDVPSPMADLPAGAKFGSLVHAVLETADPFAADLAAELEAQVAAALGVVAGRRRRRRAGRGDGADARHAAGPAGGRPDAAADRAAGSAARVGLRDPVGRWRSCAAPSPNVSAGGCGRAAARAPAGRRSAGAVRRSADVGRRWAASRCADICPARSTWCCALPDAALSWWSTTRPTGSATPRPITAPSRRLAEAMLHSDYPLQALLYIVVLHRFLRWRLPDYDPERHLGGVLYLFVRGMCGPTRR